MILVSFTFASSKLALFSGGETHSEYTRIVTANSAGNMEAEKAPLFVARNLSSFGCFVRFIDFYYYCL